MLGRLHSVLRDPYLRTFGTIASFSTLLSHWSGGSSFPLRKSTYSGKLFLLSSGICLGDLTAFVSEKKFATTHGLQPRIHAYKN